MGCIEVILKGKRKLHLQIKFTCIDCDFTSVETDTGYWREKWVMCKNCGGVHLLENPYFDKIKENQCQT